MPRAGQLPIATCQFPVSGDVRRNGRYIRRQMQTAKRKGALIVHFSETALSGYAGTDFESWVNYDWAGYEAELRAILAEAKKLKLWVVLGGSHRLTGKHKPHNSLYLIGPDGKIRDRYDKRFCTSGDLRNYAAGDHFVTFTVNGVKCALLICYDLRFPELYREYKQLGAQVMFHSFYNARGEKKGIWNVVMRPTAQAHAGLNYMYISMNNASGYYQQWPSVFIHPDGQIAKSLTQHRAGVMVNTVNLKNVFYQAVSDAWQKRAHTGHYCSDIPVNDPRSRNRRCI